MKSNIIARAALVSSFALAAALPLRAQAPASTTTVTFVQINGTTLTGGGLVTITANVADVNGLKYVSLSGAGRSSSAITSGAPAAAISLFWNTATAKAGDYKFTASGYNNLGQLTTGLITLHLVK